MQFSFSFIFHFLLSFAGFLFLGIYLCRGSWRNKLRNPLALGLVFISIGHLVGQESILNRVIFTAGLAVFGWLFIASLRRKDFSPTEVRGGHDVFSMLVGAALFALTVQLHFVLFGVPVFELVK